VLCDSTSGKCKPTACEAGAFQCAGDVLQQCNADLTSFGSPKQCGPGLCDLANKTCKVCKPGTKMCAGNTVVTCDAAGQNLAMNACDSAAPFCSGQGVCSECKSTSDCKDAPACQVASGCSVGKCSYQPKKVDKSRAGTDGLLVRLGNPDPDPIYVIYGGAKFHIPNETEFPLYGDISQVTIDANLNSNYTNVPVDGTLVQDRGDPQGHIYRAEGGKLRWILEPGSIQTCGGGAPVKLCPTGSLGPLPVGDPI
jgi:hypothetical protein